MNDIRIITRDLAEQLIPALHGSNSVYMVVSFAMKTGIELLLPHLKAAVERGADIKILTGDYLYVTEPEALSLLLQLGDEAEVRLWRSHGTAFHPKAYLLGIGDFDSVLIVGSSNLSKSALTSGIEWNISVRSTAAEQTVNEAYHEFMRLFYSDQTTPINEQTVLEYEVEYRKHYSHPTLGGNPWSEPEDKTDDKPGTSESEHVQEVSPDYNSAVSPNEAQLGALEEIRKSMEEGYDKALVVMATGLGKTYLAAFLACDFRRVLFIAHREEILEQAQRSFRNVLPDRSMGIFNGSQKVSGTDCVFASIFTLAMARHRKQFRPDDFDLMVVDEFHHAAAASYRAKLEYFRPEFLLGITATPDRADGKDIFAFCDGNLA